MGKGKEAGNHHFLFSILPKTNLIYGIKCILLSINAFSLDKSKILLFDKELNPFSFHHPMSCLCQQCRSRSYCAKCEVWSLNLHHCLSLDIQEKSNIEEAIFQVWKIFKAQNVCLALYSKISRIRGCKEMTEIFELLQCSKCPKWTWKVLPQSSAGKKPSEKKKKALETLYQ